MSDPTSAPAGWYDDGRGQQRYWDGSQWTEHTAPLPGATAETRPYDTAAIGGEAAPAASPYAETTPFAGLPTSGPTGAGGAPPAGYEGQAAYAGYAGGPGAGGAPPHEPEGTNVLGIIALVVAAVGFVFACIPFVQVVGFILLPIAFVLAIVALFMKGRKWPAITGLVVSVVGGIVGAVVFAVVAFGVFGQIVDSGVIQDEIDRQLEEEFGEPTAPASEEPGAEAGEGQVLEFGETMVWSNGVSMTVSEPESFTPSDLSAGADQAENLVFTLTITNDSAENVQPVVFSQLASGGTEATRIFDVGAEGGQVGIPPTTAILPGSSITWSEAWSVADAESLTMQTAPSFEYEDVIFTNEPQ
ncbi:DUF2510 domain-containing protein [Agromyces sp. ZXT2-3]|uniref:DUF2510 domain-containing protein n=1 Tax=Agromyces sp. ZXT2-3 TaxID=3461152 RepID=UPI004054EFF0